MKAKRRQARDERRTARNARRDDQTPPVAEEEAGDFKREDEGEPAREEQPETVERGLAPGETLR